MRIINFIIKITSLVKKESKREGKKNIFKIDFSEGI